MLKLFALWVCLNGVVVSGAIVMGMNLVHGDVRITSYISDFLCCCLYTILAAFAPFWVGFQVGRECEKEE